MDLGVAGRVALVTASSRGLGKAAASALAAEGARVVISARGKEDLEAAEAEIRSSGGEVWAVPADVTDPETPARLVDEAVSRFGGLHIVVANAGGPPPRRALEVTDGEIEAAVNANLTTSVRLVREALPHMRRAGWGRIVCIASISVRQPLPGVALSNLARTGLWAWVKTASSDLFEEGITLNLACPGSHRTGRLAELTDPPPRVGEPGDFGKVVAFLCSEPARFVSGVALGVDGASVEGLL